MNTSLQRVEAKIDEVAIIEKNVAICTQLLKLPHYQKMGAEGLLAVLMVADGLGIDKRLALNGALYMARSGCIEMKAATMSMLIRKAGHSVTKDEKSDNKICILHGKRADNGDEWTASFSVEDAKNAGLMNGSDNAWKKYTSDMLFNRALSRLARQLFPDVIGNCYVDGEISEAPKLDEQVNREEPQESEAEFTVDVQPDPKKDVQPEPKKKEFLPKPKNQFTKSLQEYEKMATEMWIMISQSNPQSGPAPHELPYWLEYCQCSMPRTDIQTLLKSWAENSVPFLKGMASWYERSGQYSEARRPEAEDVG